MGDSDDKPEQFGQSWYRYEPQEHELPEIVAQGTVVEPNVGNTYGRGDTPITRRIGGGISPEGLGGRLTEPEGSNAR